MDTLPLSQLSRHQLYEMRNQPGADQQLLAPLEHRAYAKEYVTADPWRAVPSLAVAIPAYTALKALGLKKARSPASVNEMVQGYAGIMDGLRELSR